MAYRNNDSGCGCVIAILVVMTIIAGVKNCTMMLINGEIKLPKLGSGHVSGGSGEYGTSNGYNVKYNQTTSPNYNSSSRDYTHTNSQPTEYREGTNLQHSNTNAIDNASSYSSNSNSSSSISGSVYSSSINTSSTNSNTQKPKTYYKICTTCDGTGKRHTFYWFNKNVMGSSCSECGRTDSHRHDEIVTCESCSGKGRILMEKVNGPLGEIESRHVDW